MKTVQAARMLGVDPKTIANWLNNPVLNKFFSDSASGRDGSPSREIADGDLTILNTIRVLVEPMPTNKRDWYAIADALERGIENAELPPEAALFDNRVPPIQRFTKTLALQQQVKELQNAVAFVTQQKDLEISRLQERILAIEAHAAQEKESLLRELARLEAEKNREIGKLEGQLEMYKAGVIKLDEAR